jgi:hypothetical protein
MGLKRTGHPVIILHTGREEPPDYSEFEVRDGRSMFLDMEPASRPIDFRRQAKIGSSWDEIPVEAVSSNRSAR